MLQINQWFYKSYYTCVLIGWLYNRDMKSIVYLCVCIVFASSQSQQYDAESSGSNIYMETLSKEATLMSGNTMAEKSAADTCSYTFVVPRPKIHGAGCACSCPCHKKHGKKNMTKMHEDIIDVESRMIARDAYTRREMKNLRDKVEHEKARHKMGATGTGDKLNLPENKVDTMVGTMTTEIANLRLMMSQLRRQVENLEKVVDSAHADTRQIGQTVQQGSCPTTFERYNNSCYSYFRDKKTWYKSRDFCQDLGGHLVAIETEGEQTFIQDYLTNKGVRRDTFWVYAGGNDLDNDHQWTWIGSNHIVRHPEFWYSDVTPPPDTGFVCMFLYLWDKNNFAKWTKDRCDFQMPFVCEIPLDQRDF